MTRFGVLRLCAPRLALAAFVIAPGAPVLAADCAQWNVSGTHRLVQSNMADSNGAVFIEMTLQQDGTLLKGDITFPYRNGDLDLWLTRRGDVVGTVVGSKFEATVYWEDNKVGVYSGQIGPQGLVVGRTFNQNNPAENAAWHGTPAFECLTKAAPGAGAGAGTGGKPPIALGRTNAPAASSPRGPQGPVTGTALIPQTLAPKATPAAAALRQQAAPPTTAPAALSATPVDAARNKAAAIQLKPQAVPGGGLQQAPGVLR